MYDECLCAASVGIACAATSGRMVGRMMMRRMCMLAGVVVIVPGAAVYGRDPQLTQTLSRVQAGYQPMEDVHNFAHVFEMAAEAENGKP